MEAGGQSGTQVESARENDRGGIIRSIRGMRRPLRARDVLIYKFCDDLSQILIYLMVLFSPWAFGTTQPWSIWTMNSAGYLLGLLLAVKLAIRQIKDYHPPRWEVERGEAAEPSTVNPSSRTASKPQPEFQLRSAGLTKALAIL